MSRVLGVGLVVLSSLAVEPLVAVPPIVQLSGTAGCVSHTGTGGQCVDGDVLEGALDVVVSPDGRMVYVSTVTSDAVVAFDRNLSTGGLTPKLGAALCVSDTGSGGLCGDGVLNAPNGMAMSPDGRSLYVAGFGSNSVAILDRNLTTGGLTPKAGTAGCIAESPSADCADGRALTTATDVAVSPDGRNVYVAAALADGIAVFDRDITTGALTQKAGTAGCVQETALDGCADGFGLDGTQGIVVSPDGRHVYVASATSHAVTIFDRDITTGALTQKAGNLEGCVSENGGGQCADGKALAGVSELAVSPDGGNLYALSVSSDAVAVFDRDLATGVLTQKAGTAGCVSETGTSGECTDGVALDVPRNLAISPDGRSVYVGAQSSGSVTVFDRDPTTGALTQKTGVAACVSDTGTAGSCTDGTALDGATGLAVSPGGRNVYAASFFSGAVAVFNRDVPVYDIDGDGQIEALTDSLLLLRFAFGLTGTPLVGGAVDLANCTRCTAPLIEAYIRALRGQ